MGRVVLRASPAAVRQERGNVVAFIGRRRGSSHDRVANEAVARSAEKGRWAWYGWRVGVRAAATRRRCNATAGRRGWPGVVADGGARYGWRSGATWRARGSGQHTRPRGGDSLCTGATLAGRVWSADAVAIVSVGDGRRLVDTWRVRITHVRREKRGLGLVGWAGWVAGRTGEGN